MRRGWHVWFIDLERLLCRTPTHQKPLPLLREAKYVIKFKERATGYAQSSRKCRSLSMLHYALRLFYEEAGQWLPGENHHWGEGERNDIGVLWGVMGMSIILIAAIASWVYTYFKTHQIIHLKYIHFSVLPF